MKDRRVNKHPQKKEKALRIVEECGGGPGRRRRTRQSDGNAIRICHRLKE
jgi:hypothetical protein